MSQTSLDLKLMLLLTSCLTLTSQSLNLSVLTCQMGTMVPTSREELRGPNEMLSHNWLIGSVQIRWACYYYSPGAVPTYRGLLAAEDSSLSTWWKVNIRSSRGLIWRPPLKLPTAELHKTFAGSNPSNDAGALFVLFNSLQSLLRLVLSSSLS